MTAPTGAMERKLIVWNSPAGVLRIAKPPPPRSEWYGEVVFTAIAVAIIASTALPPFANTRAPTADASAFSDTTEPPSTATTISDRVEVIHLDLNNALMVKISIASLSTDASLSLRATAHFFDRSSVSPYNGQVLRPVVANYNGVFDPHSSHLGVSLQHLLIDQGR